MSKDKVTEYIYHRETLVSSIISDVISFGSFIGLMFLNFNYWGGKWYVTTFLLVLWVATVLGRANDKIHRFYSIDECINYLETQKKKGNK